MAPRKPKKTARGRPQLSDGEGKKRNFNARIDQSLYDELDTAAAAAGKTSSALAAIILKNGLRPSNRGARSARMDSLFYLIEQLAAGCSVSKDLEWSSDQRLFDEFTTALTKTLQILRPQTPSAIPEFIRGLGADDDIREILAAPGSLARFAAYRVKLDLKYAVPASRHDFDVDPLNTERKNAGIARHQNEIDNVRKAWNLNPDSIDEVSPFPAPDDDEEKLA